MAKASKSKKKTTKKVDPPLHVNLTFEEALKKSITTKMPKKKAK
jgi:hypothetical protein